MAQHPPSHDENSLLRTLVEGTASETGSRFFQALVKNLSQALGTDGAWITEYLPEKNRLRALAFWLDNGFVDHYEYDIAGTPCEASFKNKSYLHIPENVVELFPEDPDLAEFRAVSYMGFPLIDPENNILGNIAVVDTKPMPESYRNFALFRIFVARATAEQLRLKAEAEIHAREERLKGVFNGTMDVIVELDLDFNIMMMNPAGEGIFGCNPAQCIGKSFKQFLTSENNDRLFQIVHNLKRRPKGEQRAWIPEGLLVLNTDKKKIQTDATISQIEIDEKPCYVLVLRDVDERYAAEKMIASLRDETHYLRDEIQAIYDHGNIIGQSKPFRKALELVAEVAPTDSTVLVYGETGTGKELIARSIHAASRRKDHPLITVNCAAIPDTLIESEFFGHEKGAFTGATQRREGRFSLADGGTIFLDELGELNLEMQSKLLRVLQDGELAPVGSSRNQRVDVRVIAATNRDLSQALQQGTFRTDLYYRLNVFPITIPPLRDRGNDIVELADHFIEKYASRMKKKVAPVSPDLANRLRNYTWPGNVRELQNVIERGVITARYGRLNVEYTLPQTISSGDKVESVTKTDPANSVLTVAEVQQFERDNLILALEQAQWRVAGKNGAAQLLGMPTSTLQSRIKSLGIKRPD